MDKSTYWYDIGVTEPFCDNFLDKMDYYIIYEIIDDLFDKDFLFFFCFGTFKLEFRKPPCCSSDSTDKELIEETSNFLRI